MMEWSARGPVVFVDGRQQRDTAVRLEWDDPGLSGGHGAFETIAVVDGYPVFLSDHLVRLFQSCELLGLPQPSLASLEFTATMALAAWGVPEGVLRIQVTAGGRQVVAVRAAGVRRTAATAQCVVWPSPPFPPSQAKHTSRAGAAMAPALKGVDEVIRTTPDGALLEGTWSNVFQMTAGTLTTCPDNGDILPGITRARVIELAHGLGIPVEEVSPRADCSGAAWFLTSSLQGIVPLTFLDGRPCASPTSEILSLQQALDKATGRTSPPTSA
jgi:branched-subunit amino acid aminotransferase/4-amino-4-deoxychorismate lyase